MSARLGELAESFRQTVGQESFVRFVNKLNHSDKQRLVFWQENMWDEFCAAQPQWKELNFDQIREHFQICELHLSPFVRGQIPVIEGFHFFTDEDDEARKERFPYAREYQTRDVEWRLRTKPGSTEAEVAYCPECRDHWRALTQDQPSLREHLDWLSPMQLTDDELQQRAAGQSWPFPVPELDYDESWLGWPDWFAKATDNSWDVRRFGRANFVFAAANRRIEFIYRGRGYVWEPWLFEDDEYVAMGPMFGALPTIRISTVRLEVVEYLTSNWLQGESILDVTYGLYLSSSGVVSLTEDEYPACMAECPTCSQVLLDGHLNSARVQHLEAKHGFLISGLQPADVTTSGAVFLGQHASNCPGCGASTLDMRWTSVAGPALGDLM